MLGGIVVGSFGIYRGYRLQREIKKLNAQLVHIQNATGYVIPEPTTKEPKAELETEAEASMLSISEEDAPTKN
ncbi:hypothetical protein D3C77_761310 [compost metagenome]